MSRRFSVAVLVAVVVASFAQVMPAKAAVTAVAPNSLPRGVVDREVVITGSGFVAGAPTTVTFAPGTGITVKSATASTSTTVRAVIDIAADASQGFKDVSVSQSAVNHGTCDDCFAVGPIVTAVTSGAASNADASSSVVIAGEGFLPGASAQIQKSAYGFGGGESETLNATSVTVAADGRTATLAFSGGSSLRGRAPGFWRLTFVNQDGGVGTFGNGTTAGFKIEGPLPALTAVDPARVGGGAQGAVLTLTGAGLARGTTLTFAPASGGSGTVTQAAALAWSPTAVTVPVNVAGNALGPFTITATTTDGGTASCGSCLTVSAPPTVSGVSPASLGQGAGPITVEINGQNFAAGAVPVFTGSGVAVTAVTALTATKISATVEVAETAATGDRGVAVTNPDGGTGSAAAVLSIVGGPKVTSVSPTSRPQNTSAAITVNGTNFPAGLTAAEVDFGPGVTVTGVSGLTLLRDRFTAAVTVAPDAAAGDRDVVVRDLNGGGVSVARGTCGACFNVAGLPTISPLSPSVLGQGATAITVTIPGSNFQTGATVAFTGTGVTVNGSPNRVSASELRISVTVAPGAATGSREVRVTNPDGGTAACAACFSVAAKPAVSGVTPSSRPQGFTGTVILAGSGFDPALTPAGLTFSGTGITVSALSVTSASSLTATLAITAGADTAAARDVTVTNPDYGTSTCTGCFGVSLAPVLASITPASGNGTGSVAITDLSGDHFDPAAQLRLVRGGAVVDATGEAVTQGSGSTKDKLTASVDIGAVSPGTWTVRVVNPDGGVGELVDGFTVVVPAPTVTSVAPASIPQGAANVSVQISGTSFRPGFALSIAPESGVTLSSAQLTNPSTITAVISASGLARLGPRNVTVINTDGKRGTCSSCVSVVDGDQTAILGAHNVYGAFDGGGYAAAADFDGDPANGDEVVTGAGFTGGPHVQLWRVTRDSGAFTAKAGMMVYPVQFTGGVRVAAGNFDGDPSDGLEFVTGAGPGGGPHVRIFSYDGATDQFVPFGGGFFAYDRGFGGGVYVGAADVDGDGTDEVLIGAGAGGGPHVTAWKVPAAPDQPMEVIRSFMAYDIRFTGGVTVAGGDFFPGGAGEACGDGEADEIVTGTGRGGGPHVKVWCANGRLARETMAGGGLGGAFVGAADIDADTIDEVVAGEGLGPNLRIYETETMAEVAFVHGYEAGFTGGVMASGHDIDGDGDDELIITPERARQVLLTIRRVL